MKKRMLALALIAVLTASAFAGCGDAGTSSTSTASESTTTSTSESTAATSESSGEAATGTGITYPITTDTTLSYWVELNPTVGGEYPTLGDTPFAKNLEESTGVKVEYQHPPAGQGKEQFNLLIASAALPDIIEANWSSNYPGGAEKAIQDKIALPLNDYMTTDAQDFNAYLEANPNIKRMVQTDNGNYFAFPFIRGDIQLCSSYGSMIRQDWLDELGLERPETIEEWGTVLTEFKDKKGAKAPYTYDKVNRPYDPVLMGHGTSATFQIDGSGKIVYGSTTPEYKAYLTTMADWYSKGLVDPDIATVEREQLDAKVLNGDTGIVAAWVGSGMGNYIKNAAAENPEFNLTALKYPAAKGQTSEYGYMDNQYTGNGTAVVTANSKNAQLAIQYLNFGYNEAGHMVYNFGKEGESYTMVGDYPTYADTILNDPDKSIAQKMGGNIRASYSGPFVQDLRYQEQYFQLENQKEAYKFWSSTNMASHLIPPVTPTPEESNEFATIRTNLDTYRDEMTLKFILGTESIDSFDKFVETLNSMSLDRAIEIQTAALERYNAR